MKDSGQRIFAGIWRQAGYLGRMALGAGLGLFVGQFLSMPFCLLIRSDPGVPDAVFSSSVQMKILATALWPFCAAIGFVVAADQVRRRGGRWPLIVILFGVLCSVFWPGDGSGHYDAAAYLDSWYQFYGFLLGTLTTGLMLLIIPRKGTNDV